MRCRARSRNRENVPLWVHVLLAAHRSVIAVGRSNRLMSGWQPTDPRATACWYESPLEKEPATSNGLLRSSIRHQVRLQFPAVDKAGAGMPELKNMKTWTDRLGTPSYGPSRTNKAISGLSRIRIRHRNGRSWQGRATRSRGSLRGLVEPIPAGC
jgi:hypothetical protein